MNNIANNIKQRLSMREPLCEALDVVVQITDRLTLNKSPEETDAASVFLKEELAKVSEFFPGCTGFDRDFPSLAFSIATGVGKTRLMGACITYLYLKKGIRHFFVLAPNLTLYEKLIRDFGDPGYSKYVFNGIAEFVHNRPKVITGDNYTQAIGLFTDTEVQINIFNISKFNSDNKGQKKGGVALAPKMKRLSEYLGQSYFEYLSKLDDLVILMDEAHRYHADASKNAINELKPVLGLELTATPMDEKGNSFKNIVYEYNLAQALADGKYVKSPAIAKRKNFDKGSLTEKELDLLKLEDAISVHEDTKIELEIYARNNGLQIVKPFILVACKNIDHAKETVSLIEDEMFNGQYKGKVLQIDSSTKKDEEVEELFLSLEKPDNQIEIVIHVNMLKEGWDVTNLYTIVPLRAADAMILIEQTIGRGLRLPYGGKRTGNDKVDKLTVIAHENFEAVLTRAQDPTSLLNKFSFIELPEEELKDKTEVVTVVSSVQQKLVQQQARIELIEDKYKKQQAQINLDAKKAITNALYDISCLQEVHKVDDLTRPEIFYKVLEKAETNLRNQPQGDLFVEEKIAELKEVAEAVIVDYKDNIIEIPRIDLVQKDIKAYFEWFNLDTSSGFSLPSMKQEIIRVGLMDNKVETLMVQSSGFYKDPVKMIVVQLMNFDEIDYDENAELLYHLSHQAFEAIQSNWDETQEPVIQTIYQFKHIIADRIYSQMKSHFVISTADYEKPNVRPFVKIEEWNGAALINNGSRDYRDIIQPVSMIPKFVFRGFEKACHFEYKFDSKTEQDFAYVLENEVNVRRWLRPAPNQFRIYWDNNSKRYEPDFVVETTNCIYMIETKAEKDLDNDDVQAKKKAAETYCKFATEYTTANGGKPWKYLLIPHTVVSRTASFEFIVMQSS